MEPDEDQLKSFLMEFRHFFMNDSPIYLNKIYNICWRNLTSDELKKHLEASRERWTKAHKDNGMKLVWNSKELTPEFVTDLWINGFYFHSDADFINKLRAILPHERMLVRYWFLNFLIEATRQVFYVAKVANTALSQGHFASEFVPP